MAALADKDAQAQPSEGAPEHSAERLSPSLGGIDGLGRSNVRETGKYRLLAELGRGGMANVYLAVARGPSGFNKLVVLKCLRSDLANDPDLLAMFLDEARLAARLNHPHVVQTYEVGEYLGQPVIVMEYLEGQMLANVVLRAEPTRALPLALHLRVIADALDGLHYAHELKDYDGTSLNLVHRDISPQNVFVTFDGQVKVLDFGIAKAVTSQSQTATGILKGKIKYMAPEQMLSAETDRRADIYAVGVLLWEAASGQRMWKGLSDLQVMNRVVNEGGQSLREVDAHVPPELEAIILKSIARDPAERYASAVELRAALEPLIETTGAGGSSRDLGKLMRELFEDAQRRARIIIETQLQEVKEAASDPHFIPPNILRLSSPPMRSGELPIAGTGSAALTRAADLPLAPRPQRNLTIGVATSLALALGIALATFARIEHRAPHTPSVSSAAPPAPTPLAPTPPALAAPPTPPTQVAVEIASNPPNAIIWLDGHARSKNPYSGRLANDGAAHEVRVTAPGFAARTVDIFPDRDIHLTVTLDALPARSPGPVSQPHPTIAAASHPATAAGGSASPSPSAVQCNPPFFIDSNGIKRFKPECL